MKKHYIKNIIEALGKLASFAVSFALVACAGFRVLIVFTITITRSNVDFTTVKAKCYKNKHWTKNYSDDDK